MPTTSLLPGPPVRWPLEYFGGNPALDATLDANSWDPVTGVPLKTTTEQSVARYVFGGTGQHRTVGWLDGVGGYQWWNDGNTVEGFSLFHPGYCPVLESTGSAGFIYPEATRFGWWRVSQAFTPTAGTNWQEGISGSCGMAVCFFRNTGTTPSSTATPAVPTAGNCYAYAGLAGVDDGGQQGLAVATWTEDGGVSSLGASLGVFERWHTVDLMVRQATATADATLRILLNGTEVALLSFGSDIRLPSASTNSTAPVCFFSTWCGQKLLADRPGTPRWLAPNIHFRGGAFDELGVPLLS